MPHAVWKVTWLVALLVACGSPPPPSPPTTPAVDRSAVEAAVLAPADVPTGWSQIDLSKVPERPANEVKIGNRIGTFSTPAEAVTRAESAFDSAGGDGPTEGESFVFSTALVFADDAAAEKVISAYRSATRVSNWEQVLPSGQKFKMAAAQLDVPKMGDDTVAVAVTLTQGDPARGGRQLSFDYIVFRDGPVVGVLYGNADAPALAQRFASKVAQALG
jgi:hypothetical protein